MIRFFRQDYLLQYLAIIAISILLWLPTFIGQIDIVEPYKGAILYDFIYNICSVSYTMLKVVAFVVFTITAILFNAFLSANLFIPKNSALGAFFFVVTVCANPTTTSFSPFLFACPLIMSSIFIIFQIYKTEKPEPYILNSSIILSIASMIMPTTAFLVPFIMIALLIFGFFKTNFILIPIIGFTVPYLLIFSGYYIFCDYETVSYNYNLIINDIFFDFAPLCKAETIMTSIAAAIFVIVCFAIKSNDNSVKKNKNLSIIMILFVFSIIITFMEGEFVANGLTMLVVSAVLAMLTGYSKKIFILEIATDLLFAAVVFINYSKLIGLEVL